MQITRNRNFITLTDSYKLSQHLQSPPNTRFVSSYFESRVGARFDTTTFLGLQYLLKEYLSGEVVTAADVDEAEQMTAEHLGRADVFNRKGWDRIVQKHHGRLPLRIRAVAEGTSVSVANVLMTVENTDPECYWLPQFVETLLTHVWYPSTVATLSREIKKLLCGFLETTGCEDIPGTLQFMLHDFACRGVEGMEAAGIGGLGHILNFRGTDTLPALAVARDYYGAAAMPAFSIPASEHSSMTMWGEAGERDAYANMLEQFPTGVIACVSDSWDFLRAVGEVWGRELRDAIMERDGRLVIRPDSGDPVKVNLAAADLIGERFGYTTNAAGYKVFPNQVRLIQGDGMDMDSVDTLLRQAAVQGWAAENWGFGMGGGLMQKVNRDTQRFAFKCSSANVDGADREVFKRPATDPAKDSKRGKFSLTVDEDGRHQTVPQGSVATDLLESVFQDGQLLRDESWGAVVRRAELPALL